MNKYNYDENLEQYLEDISVYKLLTKEEEVELSNKMKNGDNYAKEKLINSNLRLVVNIAK